MPKNKDERSLTSIRREIDAKKQRKKKLKKKISEAREESAEYAQIASDTVGSYSKERKHKEETTNALSKLAHGIVGAWGYFYNASDLETEKASLDDELAELKREKRAKQEEQDKSSRSPRGLRL